MMGTRPDRSFTMRQAILLVFLVPLVYGELDGLLGSLPGGIASGLMNSDSMLSGIGGDVVGSALKEVESLAAPLVPLLTSPVGGMPKTASSASKPLASPLPLPVLGGIPVPVHAKGKVLKAAVPLKKIAVKKAVGAKILAPKLKTAAVLKAKPKVYSLKPIVHVIEKPVPVFHKVPIPKKVIIPKFYPVFKPIPVPKIVPVPFKVPIKKIIPKIVKIPKAVPVPKFVPVKKPVPIAIPYPVPKFFKVPIPKPMPYPKFIPIPIPKKVPKFVPFPVKKIIKVPKPFYVPIKVPHFSASYMKTPMAVKVPSIPKHPSKFEML